jgi:hypothetical protein
MKKILLFAFLAVSVTAIACSGIPKSFCYVKTLRPNDNVIYGVITVSSGHSIQMNVIHVFSGAETRTTITVWDGTDFNCNGNIPMNAAGLGSVGDSIIAILPLISVPQNTWAVAGDYARPYWLFETVSLSVKMDTVWGYITGAAAAPVFKYRYSDFKNYWETHNNDCLALTTDIKKINEDKIRLSISADQITVNSISGELVSVKLYSMDGKLISELPPHIKQELICSHLPSGVYILQIGTNTNAVLTRKIIL